MKLKQQPEDFQVEELTDVAAGKDGPFAFYRMEKAGWSTPDALAAVRRRWKVEPRRLSYGGLKDRHARTTQYLSIYHGPRRGLEHHQVRLTYLGQIGSPYSSSHIRANRFVVTLRDLAPSVAPAYERRVEAVARCGVPNYFDDQRFGSFAGPGGEWIARLLVKGQFEGALKLALAAPYDHDRAPEKAEKRTLLRHWGDWGRLKADLPRGHARSLVDYLRVHPTDFKGAVARLRPELRGLYLSAYQSYLWNCCLARWLLSAEGASLSMVTLRTGPMPFPTDLPPQALAELVALSLPLPSSRWKPDPSDPRLKFVEAVLAGEGLTLRDLQVRGVREMFFSKGERAAWCRPANFSHNWADDELHASQRRLTLAFDLPRGSYATIVVKAVTD
ncbi:MAG: tRNA pseudouridine(13) synthase TruD [Gemmataceae bacterium]